LLGEPVISRRRDAVRRAREANRAFVDSLVRDIPDLYMPESTGPRKVAEIRCLGDSCGALPTSSYGSISSLMLHLLRDWSSSCNVVDSTYLPAINLLSELLPDGGQVLVPGAGLGRLALEIAGKGFQVEANDASRLFVTAADFLLNRPPSGKTVFPIAHLFSENWSIAEQYLEIQVPEPAPASLLRHEQPISMVPGDFHAVYASGGAGHRKFDAVVTCFFIDTMTDFAGLVDTLNGLLGEGGVWINVGPLNWKKDTGIKLSWEEIIPLWESLGYEFTTMKRIYCDYHVPRGTRMYTESYQCSLSAAVKRVRHE